MKYSEHHPGIDFSVFSKLEFKALEKHLSFNGTLPECQIRKCRVYKLYKMKNESMNEDFWSQCDNDSLLSDSEEE